eukprot:IDg23707t1
MLLPFLLFEYVSEVSKTSTASIFFAQHVQESQCDHHTANYCIHTLDLTLGGQVCRPKPVCAVLIDWPLNMATNQFSQDMHLTPNHTRLLEPYLHLYSSLARQSGHTNVERCYINPGHYSCALLIAFPGMKSDAKFNHIVKL